MSKERTASATSTATAALATWTVVTAVRGGRSTRPNGEIDRDVISTAAEVVRIATRAVQNCGDDGATAGWEIARLVPAVIGHDRARRVPVG